MPRRRLSRFDARRSPATRRVALGCLAAVSATAGCLFRSEGPVVDATPPATVDVEGAAAALRLAETEYAQGSFAAATLRADSLISAWEVHESLRSLADRALAVSGRALEAQALPGAAAERWGRLLSRVPEGPLREEAALRLVGVLSDTGREAEAVSVVLAHPETMDAVGSDTFRQLASALDIAALRALANETPPESVPAAVVHVQLARLLIVAQEGDEARRLAEAVLAGRPAEVERTTAEWIAAAETDLGSGTARIGAILPLSGDLADVGTLLREGIELAVDRYRETHPAGFDVELVLLDDGSDPDNTAGLVRSLEGEDVIAIIGPLRSESFATASRARRNPRLPILSPTAAEVLRPSPAAYTLSDAATLEGDVAEDLARWIIRDLGLRRVAVLEPLGVGLGGAVLAFTRTVLEEGGELLAHQRYDPSLTTFREPIEALAMSEPDVVFAPAASASGVLSVAPQLFYYGLYNAIVAGSPAWAEPAALRRLERFSTDHRIVGLTADRISVGTVWQRFITDYEMKYRKALRDNVIPALSHDATVLVLTALEGGRLPIPAALAAYLETEPEVDGVTGRLRPAAGRSVVRRRTELRMLVEGRPVAADRGELLTWLAGVRAAPNPFAPRDTVTADTTFRMPSP